MLEGCIVVVITVEDITVTRKRKKSGSRGESTTVNEALSEGLLGMVNVYADKDTTGSVR